MNNIDCVTDPKNKCFGCRACFNICPAKAIIMQEDEEGFFYPIVNKEKCTNCGLCKKACPSLNKSEVYGHNSKNPDCYAVMANDETRAVSSSGGAFTLIANEIFEQGGVVCGVAYVGRKVQHIIIDNPDDMYKLRGSKYVQSDTNTVYSQIKDILKTGRKVLFTGTPCQVAGLYSYLNKDYDNLVTVDLLCHGVPPQKVFDKYLEETIGDEKFLNADFRDKKQGWTVYLTVKTNKKEYYGCQKTDNYLNAFLKNMCLRPSCSTCPFTSTQREADITIGDFWKVERYNKNLNDSKGTSLILLNNKKSQKLFNTINNNFKVVKKVPIEYAKYYNITLYTPLKQHTNRRAFFRLFNSDKTLREIVDYCNKNKYDALIMNFWPYPNIGGVLVAWTLQKFLNKIGMTSALVNYQNYHWSLIYPNSISERFANKYLITTDKCLTYEDLSLLNDLSDTFILGSDCIWGKWSSSIDLRNIFMGNYILHNKKRVSYAPSFGDSTYKGDDEEKQINKYWLSRFDRISVREKSGVDILKNDFNLESTLVLDPTLLLDKEEYDKLIRNSTYDKKDYIFNYSIGIKEDDTAYKAFMDKIDGENIFALAQEELKDIDVEDWLYLIKNSKLLVTNSYHACCFAIKFNIPFYIFSPYGLDTSRFDSLLGMLNLENRILRNADDVDKIQNIFEPIDWERVNSIIKKEAERSIKWLKDALEEPKDLSKVTPADAMIQSLNNRLLSLEASMISIEDYYNLKHYKKIYFKYLKYKILKNFVSGSTRERYKNKQKIYHEKVRKVRNIKRGILNV